MSKNFFALCGGELIPFHLSKIRNLIVNKMLNQIPNLKKKELFGRAFGELIPFPPDSIKIRHLVVNKMLNPFGNRQVRLHIDPQKSNKGHI